MDTYLESNKLLEKAFICKETIFTLNSKRSKFTTTTKISLQDIQNYIRYLQSLTYNIHR